MSNEELDARNLELEQQVLQAAEEAGLTKSSEVTTSDSSSEQQNQEKTYSAEEQEAMALGWDPNHEGENFVSAKEYIRVGQIIKAKQEASKAEKRALEKIDKLQSAVNSLLDHNKKVAKISYKKAYEDFMKQRKEAILEGDAAAVDRIEYEMQKLTSEAPPVTQTTNPQGYTEEQLEFANSNKDWFNPTNPELVVIAEHEYNKQVALNAATGSTKTDKDILKIVEESVKESKEYLSKFPKSGVTRSKEEKVSLVETPSSKTTHSKTVTLSFEDRSLLAQIRLADPSFSEKDLLDLKNQTK